MIVCMYVCNGNNYVNDTVKTLYNAVIFLHDCVGTRFAAGRNEVGKAASTGDSTLLPDVLMPQRCCMPVENDS